MHTYCVIIDPSKKHIIRKFEYLCNVKYVTSIDQIDSKKYKIIPIMICDYDM